MAQSALQLTQSEFYSPVFNTAVFDGPIRIYFSQVQEPAALALYFRLQQYLKSTYAIFRQSFRSHGQTIFLMIYPNAESFRDSFPTARTGVSVGRLGEDHVIGVQGPLEDIQHQAVFAEVTSILRSLGIQPEVLVHRPTL
jgi:hypothetical protein